jgi:Arc/MetJ-type ribon-helix-helix transcriptional regulator
MPSKLEIGTETTKIHLAVPKTWVDKIDEWRAKQRPIPNKSEAIRVLVERALEAEEDLIRSSENDRRR